MPEREYIPAARSAAARLLKRAAGIVEARPGLFKAAVGLFPVVFTLLMIALKLRSSYWYRELAWREDSIVEWATAGFYGLAALFCAGIAVRYHRGRDRLRFIPYALLAAALGVTTMEEISWGQRLIGLQTPEALARINYQGEMNFHNIRGFPLHQLYIVAGLYGGLAPFLIPGSLRRRYRPIVDYFVPARYLSLYFLSVALLYLYYDHLSAILVAHFGDRFAWGDRHFIHGKDQEPAEMLLSLGFLLFALLNYFRVLKSDGSLWYRAAADRPDAPPRRIAPPLPTRPNRPAGSPPARPPAESRGG